MSRGPGTSGGDRPTGGPGAGTSPPGGVPGRRGGGPGMMGMSMGMPTERSNDFRGTVRRLLGQLRPEAPLILLVIVLAIGSVLFAVLGPRILGEATDVVVAGMWPGAGGVDMGVLAEVLLRLAGVYVLSSVLGWAQAWIMAGITQRTVYRLREQVEQKLGRLPLRTFDARPRGELLSRVTNDIDNIGQVLQQSLTQLITAILTIVGVLAMMLLISPLLAVVSLLAVPVSMLVTVLIARRAQPQFRTQWASTGVLNGHIEEMHTGHTVVQVFGRQAEAIATFDAENERLYQSSYRAQAISGLIQPALNIVSNLNYVIIAVIGGLQVTAGAMSLGGVVAFIQYARQFTFPILQTASIANVLQSAVASAERVFELLDEPEETADPTTPMTLDHVAGHVRFEDVSFRYLPERPLISDLSLDVAPGRTVAIVGPTGAGKTTLVNLLMRFYDVDEGAITLDGVDIRQLTRDQLRGSFGMVLQDTWLFHGTIRDNLRYGRLEATDEELLAAAEAAHVDHFVRTLPDGYDTIIDDDASNLSAGEKQLLTIARAFLADPPMLILDEATSSVDTRTEVLIQRAMARLMEGRTTFVIAHRLSTIRDAHTILVMDAGRIVEQGTHEELLAREGAYAELYRSQFAGPVEDAA
ncbi:MAG: ABC transporter ATP-binding protein [Chloroflexi bacterium]|nr:ABC transporter ATP-binding protein [Chloroflexota bacterium]